VTVLGIRDDIEWNFPVCVMAEGNRPPEDVGGIGGYQEYLEIMKNPDDPRYLELQRWSQAQGYLDVDIEIINRQLRHVLHTPGRFS
jgi:hypothetical protein